MFIGRKRHFPMTRWAKLFGRAARRVPSGGVSPIAVDLLMDGEQGSDNDTLTVTMLNNMERSSAGFPSGTWSIGGTNSWKIKTQAEFSGARPFDVDGVTYFDTGSRGLALENYGQQGRYIQYDFNPDFNGSLSFGAWVWCPLSNTDYPTMDSVHFETNTGYAVAQYVDYGSGLQWRMHTSAGTGGLINCSYETWYWLTFEALQNASCRLRLYTTAGTLVGTSTLSQPVNESWQWMRIGRPDGHGNYSSITGEFRIDDFVIDVLDQSYPLGPPL